MNVEENIFTKNQYRIRLLGAYQLIGGVIGCVLNAYAYFTHLTFLRVNIILPFLVAGLFCYSIFCGLKCLQLNTGALYYSLYNQIFQLLQITILGLDFKYSAGFYVDLGVDLSESFILDFKYGLPTFRLFYGQDFDSAKTSINLLALLLIFYLDLLLRRAKKTKPN